MVAGDVSGAVCAGLPVGTIQSSGLASPKSGEGSIGTPAPHSRSGPCSASIWASADLGVAAARRLVRKSETGTAALSTRRFVSPHAGAAAQAYRPAPRTGTYASRTNGALEHGFCA